MALQASRRSSIPLDYVTLQDPRPTGRIVGRYAGIDFAETIVSDGRRYVFTGIAQFDADGRFDPEELYPGEFFVAPGLIYRLLPKPTGWLRPFMGRLGLLITRKAL
jgi:hypothetical protein